MSLVVKAFLEKNGDVKGEIRRFQVPTDTPAIFENLLRMVTEVFTLGETAIQLYWQDPEGDFVTFSSTEELKEAVSCSADGILRLFVKITGSQPDHGNKQPDAAAHDSGKGDSRDEKIPHPGVVCDGCEGSIYGPRYKCVICPDYDLCSNCEQKGIHSHHDKFKITHPQFAGGPNAFVPPHFRRWMHRFMKKWHENHPGQCPTGASATGETGNAEQKNGAQEPPEDEFLKNVGADIASFLDPFGIDVTYEVRHEDQRHEGHAHCGNRQGHGGRSFPRGCPMFSTQGQFNAGGCMRFPWQTESGGNMTTDKSSEKDGEKSTEQSAKNNESSGETPMEQEKTKQENATPGTSNASASKDRSRSHSPEDEWMFVAEGETTTDGRQAPSSSSATGDSGIYPNLRVTEAVEMMKAMGFNDEGGWLTRLLETTAGDIARALDTLKLGASQASNLA